MNRERDAWRVFVAYSLIALPVAYALDLMLAWGVAVLLNGLICRLYLYVAARRKWN